MSNISKFNGHQASETPECFPVERSSTTTGRVTEVKWVPKETKPLPKFKTWVSVYRVFMSIANTIWDLPEGIDNNAVYSLVSDLIESLYVQHKGEPAWDIAYTKWSEPSYDNEEE